MENENIENKELVVDDDAELDKSLNASIEAIRSGKPAQTKNEPNPEVQKEEEKENPEAPKEEGDGTPQPDTTKKDGEYDYRIPNKGKFESDESFEKRVELMDLVKRRKLAKTDEQRQEISDKIKETKSQLKSLNSSDKINNTLNKKSDVPVEEDKEVDEALKADKERLKQLGGATKEDIQAILQEERQKADVKNTLEKFVDRHSELKDEDTREVFFDFVDSNYNWQNKSGKELMTVLELARENMFKPSETIQERVLKAANVQEKVNAMQFPGGTIPKNNYSPEVRRSLDEMMATGMSEEKALELISD